MNELNQMFTVADVANMTSMSDRTIRNYLRDGLLAGRKVGGQWRFTMQDIERFLRQGEITTAVEKQQRAAVLDFIDGVNPKMSCERQACMVVDLYVSKEDGETYNEKICERVSNPNPDTVYVYYHYSVPEQRARFTVFSTPETAATVLEILKQ